MNSEISLEEFGKCIVVLISGMGKSMPREQIAVYHQMLKDLPLESLQLAVKRALCEHEYATIPSIAALRRLATEQSESGWALAMEKVSKAAKIAFYEPEAARDLLDERTLAAVNAIGWERLHDLDGENRGTFVAQFRNSYEALERTEAKTRVRIGIEGPKRDSIEASAISGLAGRLAVTE